MGYRSDVSVVFYTLDAERLPLAALKLWFDENYPHEGAKAEWAAKIEEGDDYLLVNYTAVKWGAGADHPKVVDAVLRRFIETFDEGVSVETENGPPAAYDFVRIGEDDNDIETDRSGWTDYRLDVRREIVFA
jgi:hypothetical protein